MAFFMCEGYVQESGARNCPLGWAWASCLSSVGYIVKHT